MNPLTVRARLLELEAELQRVTLGVTLAQARAQAMPLRVVGASLLTAGGWLLRRRFARSGRVRLLGRLWAAFR
jgi:hypothetical protein